MQVNRCCKSAVIEAAGEFRVWMSVSKWLGSTRSLPQSPAAGAPPTSSSLIPWRMSLAPSPPLNVCAAMPAHVCVSAAGVRRKSIRRVQALGGGSGEDAGPRLCCNRGRTRSKSDRHLQGAAGISRRRRAAHPSRRVAGRRPPRAGRTW
jgi:hypothetical protein